MTEYELLDLIGTWKADTASGVTTFISILSAYILTAYIAGANMTRAQVAVISLLMIFYSALLIFQISVNQLSIIEYHEMIRPDWGEKAIRNGVFTIWAIGITGVISILATLWFMWSVRQPRRE